jgi:KEOPS complex subunit Cgi121
LTDEYIAVIGFRNVQIKNVTIFLEQFRKEGEGATIVQFFDAKRVAGPQHPYFAAVNALNAFARRSNVSNTLAVEALLYASAQRQITKAVEMLGIKKDSSEVAVLIIAKNKRENDACTSLVAKLIPGERDDSVLELTAKKIKTIKKLFKISDLEFESKLKSEGLEKEALTDLVIERAALLATRS